MEFEGLRNCGDVLHPGRKPACFGTSFCITWKAVVWFLFSEPLSWVSFLPRKLFLHCWWMWKFHLLFLNLSLICLVFFWEYCSLCNMPRPYRAPHVGLNLLLLKLFLLWQKKCQCHIVWADELLCTVHICEAGISSGWWHLAKYISVLLLHSLLKGPLRSLRQLPLCWTCAQAICELISSCCFESYVESLSFRILSEYFRPFPLHSSSP